MRLLAVLHLLVLVDAKWKQPRKKSGLQDSPNPPKNHRNPYEIYEYPLPVDFINMGKEGIIDPSSGLKQPFDALAMSLRYPNSPEEEENMLKTADPRNIIRIAKTPKYRVPRINPYAISVREYNPDVDEEKIEDMHKIVEDAKMPPPFDFEMAQAINIALPNAYRDNIAKAKTLYRSGTPGSEPGQDGNDTEPFSASKFFSRNSFDILRPDFGRSSDNWTSCEEFAVNAHFHPREVAGVEWVIFYTWARTEFPRGSDFKFSYPTKQLVHNYKTEYGPYLDERIDWKQPMLLLKTWMELLLVAGDRRGLFYGIPKDTIPENAKKPTLKIDVIIMRMKMVDQYLAVMLCEDRMALMLAAAGDEPDPKNMEKEAAKLGFRGIGRKIVKVDYDEIPQKPFVKFKDEDTDQDDIPIYEPPTYRKTPFFNDDPFLT